jgi:hypothetical protein
MRPYNSIIVKCVLKVIGRLRSIWEDNIIMDLRELGCDVVDWIHLAHSRNQWLALVNMLSNLLGSLKDREFHD